jgi:hypothetical protein
MKQIKFVRFGGLSPVNHKKFYKQDSFHSPPCKKGIYAFIFPYIEDFLWAWKVPGDGTTYTFSKYRKENRREFTYEGKLWVHWLDEARKLGLGLEYKKDWVKIHTSSLLELLKLIKQEDRVQLKEKYNIGTHENIHDPYKRGLGGFMSKDHLEVFIERI